MRLKSTLSGSPNDQVINGVLLAITGLFIGGPSNIISSAISADLGRQDALRGSKEALATVTGIVDGTGSIGAAAGQVKMKKKSNWRIKQNEFGSMRACLVPLMPFCDTAMTLTVYTRVIRLTFNLTIFSLVF